VVEVFSTHKNHNLEPLEKVSSFADTDRGEKVARRLRLKGKLSSSSFSVLFFKWDFL
jgi:hypothetical protein